MLHEATEVFKASIFFLVDSFASKDASMEEEGVGDGPPRSPPFTAPDSDGDDEEAEAAAAEAKKRKRQQEDNEAAAAKAAEAALPAAVPAPAPAPQPVQVEGAPVPQPQAVAPPTGTPPDGEATGKERKSLPKAAVTAEEVMQGMVDAAAAAKAAQPDDKEEGGARERSRSPRDNL